MPFFHFAKDSTVVPKGYKDDIECNKCDYIAINKRDLKEHKREKHAY